MNTYLIIGGWKAEVPIATIELTKEDLVALKNGDVDWIIDISNGKYFDAKENVWKNLASK